MPMFQSLRLALERNPTVSLYECRLCGTQSDSAMEECPECEECEIAEYDLRVHRL